MNCLITPKCTYAFTLNSVDEVKNATSDINSDSEDEGEFVPSSWDSMAQPARSALKSPDKILDEEVIVFEIYVCVPNTYLTFFSLFN